MLDFLALLMHESGHLSLVEAVFLGECFHELPWDFAAGKHELIDTLPLLGL
jgi:hypothetical protein